MPGQRDVVESEVPYAGIDHPVSTESHNCPNDGASNALQPGISITFSAVEQCRYLRHTSYDIRQWSMFRQ